MLGLPRRSVRLVPYQSAWRLCFEEEAGRLQEELGTDVLRIEHVGSTSIPGLDAKPIIDIVVGVRSLANALALTPVLEKLGYDRRPNGDSPSRLFYVKGPETLRTHHLSLTDVCSPTWVEHIAFRDYLRTHAETREEYLALKRRLAWLYPDDRPSYTAKKAEFISKILKRAHQGSP